MDEVVSTTDDTCDVKPNAEVVPLLPLSQDIGASAVLDELHVVHEEAQTVEQQISETESRMKSFEANTQYLDAERERKALQQLKERRKALTQRHVETYQKVDSEQLQGFARSKQKAFDNRWEKAFEEHNQKTRKQYAVLKRKHEECLCKLRVELEKKTRVPKFSTQLLTLRKKQLALARCQRYVEADNIRKSGDTMEEKELEEHKRHCQQHNQMQVDMMLNQQHMDMSALRQKTKLDRKVMMEERNKDQQQLDCRIRNSQVEMDRMHAKQALVAKGKLFDTGFYTQRGAARSSIHLGNGHLLTSTSTHSSADNASNKGNDPVSDPSSAPKHTDPSPLENSGPEPAQRTQKQHPKQASAQKPADARHKTPQRTNMLTKQDQNKPKKSVHKPKSKVLTKRGACEAAGVGDVKGQRVPGRRRQEFSVRNLARDKKQGRS